MTVTYFSVVQFAPNPFSGEKVNIGLVVFNPESSYGRVIFEESVRRARRLAPDADVAVVEQMQHELEAVLPSFTEQPTLGLDDATRLDLEALEKLHRDSGNVIQFTKPLASSEDPVRLVERLRPIYLPRLPGHVRSRDARAVRGRVKRELSNVGLTDWVREDFLLAGRNDQYRFDLALVGNGNGGAAQIIETMALAKADVEATHRELDALGYSIYDVRANQIHGPFALVVAPDTSGSLVRLAERILIEFDAEVVEEAQAPDWVAGLSERLLTRELP